MIKLFLLLLTTLVILAGCTTPTPTETATPAASPAAGDAAFKTIHDKYVIEFLRRNPTVNTYLGGAGLDPSLTRKFIAGVASMF